MRVAREVDWVAASWISLVHVAAVVGTVLYVALHDMTWAAAALATGLFGVSELSITAGYHRLFAHGTYRAHPIVRAFYLFFGAGAFQNRALQWASVHRRHHARVDGPDDPYGIQNGFWWAHMGWVFFKDPLSTPERYAADLKADPLLRLQDRFFIPIATAAGLVLPLALGFLVGDPWGGFVLGGLVRLVCLYHATFFINSAAHTLGTQPYSDKDSSRDSAITALLSLGEGYHNYHHTFPFDYRNGFRPWHFDPGKWWIRALSWVGLAKDLVRAPSELILKAKFRMQERKATAKFAERPQVAELLRSARVKMEALLDRWAALKIRFAKMRAKIDRGSREALDAVRHEIDEIRRSFREAQRLWFRALCRPEILAVAG